MMCQTKDPPIFDEDRDRWIIPEWNIPAHISQIVDEDVLEEYNDLEIPQVIQVQLFKI